MRKNRRISGLLLLCLCAALFIGLALPAQAAEPAAPAAGYQAAQEDSLTHLRTSYNDQDYLDISISGSTLTVSGSILAQGLNKVQVSCGTAKKTVDAASGQYFSVQLTLSHSGIRPVNVYTSCGGSTFSSYMYNRIYTEKTSEGYQIMPSLVMDNNSRYNESNMNPQFYLNSQVPSSVAAKSDEIVGDETDPYTKVFLIYQWVVENIHYDYPAISGGTRLDDSASVLERRCGVCAGYSYLLRDMILAQGIPAISSSNLANYGSYALSESGGEDHAHTEAYVNGRWIVMDATWDSNNKYYGGDDYRTKAPNGYYYFDITPEAFAMDHKITTRGGISGFIDQNGFITDSSDPTLLLGYQGKAGKVVVPEGITVIGEYAFSTDNPHFPMTQGITQVVLPDSVTAIEEYAFLNCDRLISVTLPEGLRTIGNQAFGYCTAMKSVSLPDTLATIGDSAFYGSGLTEITFPDSLESVGRNAFYQCAGLTSVTIPAGIRWNGDFIFAFCTGLRSVTLEEGVTEIHGTMFYGCTGITRVSLPASLTSVGVRAFYNCGSIEEVIYGGTESEWAQIDIGADNDALEIAAGFGGEPVPEKPSGPAGGSGSSGSSGSTGGAGGSAAPTISAWAKPYIAKANQLMNFQNILNAQGGLDYVVGITREKFAALAVRTYETCTGRAVPVAAGDDMFSDSTGSTALAKAYNLGIVTGCNRAEAREDVLMEPTRYITREQAATMLARMCEAMGCRLTLAESIPFTDEISSWAYDSVAKVYKAGLMNGTGSYTFDASDGFSVEQAVTTMYRAYLVYTTGSAKENI